MLTHRTGSAVVQCDRCYRLRADGEDGWRETVGFPVAAAVDVIVDAGGKEHPTPKVQPAQPGHLCPECARG